MIDIDVKAELDKFKLNKQMELFIDEDAREPQIVVVEAKQKP